MVSPTQYSTPGQSKSISIETAREELRVLLGLYDRMIELMRNWSGGSGSASDATVITVCEFYQSLCRDLDLRMAQFQDAAVKSALPIDFSALREAREHLFVVMAIKAGNILKGEQDVREGRTITLEQLRRELRNPAH